MDVSVRRSGDPQGPATGRGRRILGGVGGGALDRLAGAGRLATLCTRDVQVLLDTQGAQSRRLQGREEVRHAGVAARAQLPWLRLQLSDVEVRIVESGVKATVLMAATVRAAGASEPVTRRTYSPTQRVDNRRVEIIVRESLIDDYVGEKPVQGIEAVAPTRD